MKVTREVITDLLPAYLSKEASSDTQALVEEFFKQDPAFEKIVKENKNEEMIRHAPATPLPKDHESETLIRAQNMMKWRTHWLTMALIFTVMPLCCVFSSKGLEWIMWRDAPYASNVFVIFALTSWVFYIINRRKARVSRVRK
jgi:hypothetical protein